MRKIRSVLLLSAIIFTQPVLANDASNMTSSHSSGHACDTIAKACITAGFVRTETPGKRFWHDCMKPILLGRTVAAVKTDPSAVQACRTYKIEKLKKELQELEKSSANG